MADLELSEAPASILMVAGVYNEQSLGWAAAEAWLDRDPNHQLVLTTRSWPAEQFVEAKKAESGSRIHHMSGTDWTHDSVVDDAKAFLDSVCGGERQVAGLVHAIAGADRSNFEKPAHELPSEVYVNAIEVSAVSLASFVQAARGHLRPNAGVVTFGFGEHGQVVEGYGGAMSVAKAALSQMVVELGVSLAQAEPCARTAEIVTGFIPTYSGRGVALAQRVRPRTVVKAFANSTPLPDSTGEAQREAAARLAVSFVADSAYQQTTGRRLYVDGGWSLKGTALVPPQ